MDHLDDAWCPVCDRAILPKRITIQVPVEVPAAPQTESTPTPVVPTRTRSSGGRPRGLVHGTGRAKALAPVKRTATKEAIPAPTPIVQMKTRTVIDQSPAPLYCSDECRMVDLHRMDGGLHYNTDPFRQPFDYRQGSLMPISPTRKDSSTSETESTSSSSDNDSSIASSVAQSHAFALSYAEMSPSMGKLAEMYNFPALPAPLPCFTRDAKTSTASLPARRVSSPEPVKASVPQSASAPVAPAPKKALSPSERYTANLAKKPVALDTSIDHAMRDTIIPVAYPNNFSTVRGASRHTSASASRPSTVRTSSMPPRSRGASTLEAMYGPSCPLLDTSREAARAAAFSPSSLPSAPIPRRESMLVAAQGKLLVPNVTIKRKTSSSSLASVGSGIKSPLSPSMPRRGSSMSSDAIPEELEQEPDTLAYGPFPRRSSPSEDRVPFTYDVQPWTEIVYRKEYRYTKGVEHEVQVPVRVPKYVSSLCLGPDGKDPRYEARRARERAVEASLKVEEARREAELVAVEQAKEKSVQLRRNLAALVAA